MTISIEELLTTYWSQITLILAILGYFFKRIFDAISKKREINHNLFQVKKLEAVNKFFAVYSEVEEMWTEISYWDIMENKLTAKEIDNLIFPSLRKMRKCNLELHIYFDQKQMTYFNGVYKNMLSINGALSKEYFDFNSEKNIITKTNNFLEIKDNEFKKNETLMNKIYEIVKQSFK